MNSERDRIASAAAGGVIVAAAVGLLLVLLGGCDGARGDGDDGCDWFALSAAVKPVPPAKDRAPARAPSLDKRPAAPAPAPTKAGARKHRGTGFDLCDD